LTRIFTPYEHQLEALQHLYTTPRGALWMPMGGGKTVTTLTALVGLDLVEEVFPALVLAPLRVARTTWPEEVEQWAHLSHLRVSAITGTPMQRARALAAEADIYTMNYDNLVWLREALGDDWPFKTVIADEFTRLKGFRVRQGGKRSAALRDVAHTKVKRFIGLTGTPGANGIKDLWGQTWFLDKGQRLGQTFTAFEQRWFTRGRDGPSLKPYDHAQEEVQGLLRDICRTVSGLTVDEPNKVLVYVEMPNRARTIYKAMEAKSFAELSSGETLEAVHAAAKMNKCLQIANGAAYVDDKGNWEPLHEAKLDALESIYEEAAGANLLVAYNFISDLERIKTRFPFARHLDADPATIKAWNAGGIRMLLAHPASAGHGLNLQHGGHHLVFFGLNWNLEEHMQIIERIGPQRQKQSGYDRPVVVYYIITRDTVDTLVMDRLETKRSVQDILLEAMRKEKE